MTADKSRPSGEGMARWRFAESETDGEDWLANPNLLQGYVDYAAAGAGGEFAWRRILIVTRAWLEAQIQTVGKGQTGPLWAAIPSMIVLPNASGSELRSMIDEVIRQGSIDDYSTELGEGEDA